VQCEAVFLLFRRFWDCASRSPRLHRTSTYGLGTATMIAGLDEFMAKAERWSSVVTMIMIADGIAVGIMIGECTPR
jgi:hypothetical protein